MFHQIEEGREYHCSKKDLEDKKRRTLPCLYMAMAEYSKLFHATYSKQKRLQIYGIREPSVSHIMFDC